MVVEIKWLVMELLKISDIFLFIFQGDEEDCAEIVDMEDEEYNEDNPSSIQNVANESDSALVNTNERSMDVSASTCTSNETTGTKKSPLKRTFKSPKKVPKQKYRNEDPRVTKAYDYLVSRKNKDENTNKKEKHECDIFGEFIATKLKKEDAETREIMMYEIHRVMFDI